MKKYLVFAMFLVVVTLSACATTTEPNMVQCPACGVDFDAHENPYSG
jgi:hypothetical protein